MSTTNKNHIPIWIFSSQSRFYLVFTFQVSLSEAPEPLQVDCPELTKLTLNKYDTTMDFLLSN